MPKIEQLYAWVIADSGPDDEGIPTFTSPVMPGMALPMMGADLHRATSMREIAQQAANAKGKSIKLIRSTDIELVEILEPQK